MSLEEDLDIAAAAVDDEADSKPKPINPASLAAATEEADEFYSIVRPLEVPLIGGGTFKVTHPNMLDDDQQEAYEALQHRANHCDRHPDVVVPERTIKTASGTVSVTAEHTVRGDFIQPYEENGVLLSPSFNVQLAKILLGEDGYAKFKAAGGRSNQISIELRRRAKEIRERADADSKSADGGSGLAPVPDAD